MSAISDAPAPRPPYSSVIKMGVHKSACSPSVEQRKSEDGDIAQGMDGDGDHQAPPHLIGERKDNTPNRLGHREPTLYGVDQYK
jgi:hypothetical protein